MRNSRAIRAAAVAAAVTAALATGTPRSSAQDGQKPGKPAARAQDGGASAALRGALEGQKGDGAAEVINATQLPEDVSAALKKAAPDAEIQEITRRTRGNGEVYTLRILVAAKPRVVSFFHALTGTMVEACAAADLPDPVLDAFEKAMPEGLPAQFDKVTTLCGADEGTVAYIPVLAQKRADGQKPLPPPVVTVSADGQTLTIEETVATVPDVAVMAVQRQFPHSTIPAQPIRRVTVNDQASYTFLAVTQDGRRLLITSTAAGEITAQKGDGMAKPGAAREGDAPAGRVGGAPAGGKKPKP